MNNEDYIGQLIENERLQLRDKFDQQKTEYFNNLIKEKDKEIERLNNILKEYEKWLKERLEKLDINGFDDDIYNGFEYSLDKLKELKEGK